jgi:hypothetical protein
MPYTDWLSQNLGIPHTYRFCIASADFLFQPENPLPQGTFGRPYATFLFLSAAQAIFMGLLSLGT